MIYFDTSYLVRLYVAEPGFEAVRKLAVTAPVACCALGRVETAVAFDRKLREGHLSPAEHRTLCSDFEEDCSDHAFRWLPISDAVFKRAQRAFEPLNVTVFLRAADALHLACAAENGLHIVYSNDRHFLAAAPHFALRASNVI